MTFGSEDVELIDRAISFQDFQPMVMIHQRHRWMDRRYVIALSNWRPRDRGRIRPSNLACECL